MEVLFLLFLLQISDQGGGIAKVTIDKLFNYMYSTAPRPPSPQASSVTPLVSYISVLTQGFLCYTPGKLHAHPDPRLPLLHPWQVTCPP